MVIIKSQTTWIQIQDPPLPNGVTLGKTFNLSMLQFLHLQYEGDNSTYFFE